MNRINRDYIENMALNAAYFALEKIEILFHPLKFVAERYRRNHPELDKSAKGDKHKRNTYGLSLQQIEGLTKLPNLEELYNTKSKGIILHTAYSSDKEQVLSLIFNYLPKRGWLDQKYDRVVTKNHNPGFILSIVQDKNSLILNNEQSLVRAGIGCLSISFREHSKGHFGRSGPLSVGGNFKTGMDYLKYIAERENWLKFTIDGVTATAAQTVPLQNFVEGREHGSP